MKKTASANCPCCGQKLPERDYILDDKHRVVIRNGMGIHLSIVQYAIFRAIYRKKHAITNAEIINEVYRGSQAPMHVYSTMNVSIRVLNGYIADLGLKLIADNQTAGALWRIQEIA